MRDYYRILDIPENAGTDEIKRAYRTLARRHHPDMSGQPSGETFKAVHEAYETLSDLHRRRSYDAQVAATRRSARLQQDWLRDEVAIDFPSIGGLIDRIRESFIGEEEFAAPLSAEILLTPAEASRGVMVPMQVPVRSTCRQCGGRGEVWMELCAVCAGSGASVLKHQVDLSVPAGVQHGMRFRFSVTPPYAPKTVVEVRITVQ